jgi:signal transduction histidine kinase
MAEDARAWSLRDHWVTVVTVGAVAAVTAAGLWGIAVARRDALQEAGRMLEQETAARARAVEAGLLETRADLVFLAGSSAVSRLEGLGRTARGSDEEWRRVAAEAVLVFLRAHPEVARLTIQSGRGQTLVRTGRRGGVPVLWASAEEPPGGPAAATPVRGAFDFGGSGPHAVHLVADLELASLLGGPGEPGGDRCTLRDGGGRLLAGSAATAPAGEVAAGEATVRAEGWQATSPWTLRCAGRGTGTAAVVEPVARRYRMSLALNVGVMGLTALLGSFAIQQARRRARLESRAQEERRVRELERQLFHAERLGTVGRLAAGLAHEINNPLEGMSNYLTLAQEDLGRGDAAGAGRRLERIGEGIERVAAIVRQVLGHADPATAATTRTPVDVGGLARQTVDFVKSRREFSHLDFALDEDETGAPLVVPGNAVTLGQLLLNTVLNACEAQPAEGEVRVSARREDGHVVIEVADRGPGIPPGDRARIFEPFYSTKQSTGLGLSVCHAIVSAHQGELLAEDRTGGGAVFRIRLPA